MSEEKKKLQGGASHKVRNGESTAVAIKRTIPERKADAGIARKAENFVSPIVDDVIIPAAQDTIISIVQSIANGVVNGIIGAITGQPVQGNNMSVPVHRRGTYENYNGYSRTWGNVGTASRGSTTQVRESTRLKDLTVRSRAEATEVINQLYDIMDRYHRVSCNDLYGLPQIDKTCPYTYVNYGWTDLGDAGIISNSDGTWSFDLPTPRKIS